MGSPFFSSKYLSRTVYLSEIDEMPEKDISSLKAELRVAVSVMQEKMHNERDVADSDWLYGIALKIKICEQFLSHIDEFNSISASKLDHYHLLHFKQKVSDQLGPLEAHQLFLRARREAVGQLRKESRL